MDIWSFVIILLVVILIIYGLIHNSIIKSKDRDRIRKLYAYIYQTKDHIRFLSAFHDHLDEIKKQCPQIKDSELEKIKISLLRKSMALAVATHLRAEYAFDFIKNNPFTNVALQKEDRNFIDNILKAAYEKDYDKYSIDLDDDVLDPIYKILQKETNKKIYKNV